MYKVVYTKNGEKHVATTVQTLKQAKTVLESTERVHRQDVNCVDCVTLLQRFISYFADGSVYDYSIKRVR